MSISFTTVASAVEAVAAHVQTLEADPGADMVMSMVQGFLINKGVPSADINAAKDLIGDLVAALAKASAAAPAAV